MGKKTRSVTFRCPDEIYQALSNFALDKGITKDDEPIISEALVTALLIGLGLDEDVPTSNTVSKDALQQIQEQIDDLSNKLSNTVSKDELKEAIARLEAMEPAKPSIASESSESAPIIEERSATNTVSIVKPKTKQAKSGATAKKLDELNALNTANIRKLYRSTISPPDRTLDPNYASKDDMITAILEAKI